MPWSLPVGCFTSLGFNQWILQHSWSQGAWGNLEIHYPQILSGMLRTLSPLDIPELLLGHSQGLGFRQGDGKTSQNLKHWWGGLALRGAPQITQIQSLSIP